jgi:hypothetical protein
MVLGPSSGQAGEDDATGLRGSAHWRLAVRGLRLARPFHDFRGSGELKDAKVAFP